MIPSVKSSVLLGAALAGLVASTASAQQALPPLPGNPGATAPAAAPATPPQAAPPGAPAPAAQQVPTAQQLYEHVRNGVVVLQRNGLPVAIGTVLGTDGRILTALSGLGGGDGADVLYADGTSVHAKVDHSDADSDLALLAPATAKVGGGLAASGADPTGALLRALVPSRGARLQPAEAGVKGKAEAHAKDGQALPQMLDVNVKGPLFAGAPLLDGSGDVVAVLVRACKGAAAAAPAPDPTAVWLGWGAASQPAAKAATCSPVVVGAPVAAIRSFLMNPPAAPAAATPPPAPATPPAPAAPWLGIRGEPQSSGAVRGVHVLAVAPQSPAATSGLQPNNDVIAAVDGEAVDTPQKLSAAIAKHAPGDTVKLLVFGQGKFREVSVALLAAP